MRQRLLCSALFLGLTIYLGYFVQRTQFSAFFTAYSLFFGLYAYLLFTQNLSAADRRWYTWLGLGLRAVLLFSLPNLSDDFYRFLWDGRLLAQGINPFVHPPAFYLEQAALPPGLTSELFARLNSPQYHTVYPPVCQAVFALAAWLFPHSDWGAVVGMKVFLLGCESATVWMLSPPQPPREGGSLDVHHAPTTIPSAPEGPGSLFPANLSSSDPEERGPLQAPPLTGGLGGAGLFYALNPLAILEIVGNCHFEGAMIAFLLAGLVALKRGRWALAAPWWALATASKLLPPLFLPLIWRWLGWRRGGYFILLFGAVTLLLFAPLLQPAVLANISASLRLYFRQFEFNASVYYLVKQAGTLWTDKNIARTVGPLLGLCTALTIVALAWKALRRDAPLTQLYAGLALAASLYLFNATTVHPWYVTVPLALSLGSRWRFAVGWSGLAALSYSHYAGGGFQEKYSLLALEYGLVWAWLAGEIWSGRARKRALR